MIDFHEMLETIRDVMSKVTLAITVVGGLVLFSGALILIGAVAMTKFQRVYEAAVFKTLGANTRTIARMLLFEYGVLGSLAGADRIARRRRPHLGRQPLRARDSVARLRRRAHRRRGADGDPGRRHRRRLQPRRPAATSRSRRCEPSKPAFRRRSKCSGLASRYNVCRAFLEHRFALAANGTTVRTEVLAGLTTFLTMAYIIFVQPAVLSAAGMDFGAVLTATCLATAFATVLMALLANYPIAVAPAMGHNFFFAYSVVIGMKVPWQRRARRRRRRRHACSSLTAGIGLRERLITAIPASLKHAIAAGIGLLIATIGLQWAGLDRRRAGHARDARRPAQPAGRCWRSARWR